MGTNQNPHGLGPYLVRLCVILRAKFTNVLPHNEALLRTQFSIDRAKDAIFWVRPDGSFHYVNEAACQSLGYTKEELLSMSVFDVAPQFPRERWKVHWEKSRILGSYMIEAIHKTKDGYEFPVEIAIAFMSFSGEEYHCAYARDITERKNAEKERERLQSQLIQAQKMESIGQLAGGVAHDFNNILTAIIGYGTILKMKMADDDPLRNNVNEILESAGRAAELTHSLLAFSRKQVLNMQPIDLNGIIHGQEEFLRRIIGEDIEMKCILRDNAAIMADSGQIGQVLMNLAANARDAMPKGGHLTIETELMEFSDTFIKAHGFGVPGTYAVISITDSGIGMDENAKQKIFEPFFTTKEVGRGTGLGLAIVYGIIKQHKGYINVYSQVGEGTTFKIYLPVHRGQVDQPGNSKVSSPMKTGNETILLAEDDGTLRTFFRNILTEQGYTVIVAENGEDAVSKFTEYKDEIQLLIVDMIMPKQSGREVFEAVQKIKPGTKVIFSSGYTQDKVQQEGIPAGSEFIAKPAPPQAYLRKVRDVLDGKMT